MSLSAAPARCRPSGRSGGRWAARARKSLVGLGTWGLGGLISRPITAEAAVALLRSAFEREITLFDSSDSYGGGRAEVLLGAAFSAAGDRERVVYVTKAGYLPGLDGAQSVRRWDANTSPDRGRWPVQDFSPAYLRWACELSLRRLQTDYIDAYLLHDPPRGCCATGRPSTPFAICSGRARFAPTGSLPAPTGPPSPCAATRPGWSWPP